MQLHCTCIRNELHTINFLPRSRCVGTSYRKTGKRPTRCFDSCKRAPPVSDRQILCSKSSHFGWSLIQWFDCMKDLDASNNYITNSVYRPFWHRVSQDSSLWCLCLAIAKHPTFLHAIYVLIERLRLVIHQSECGICIRILISQTITRIASVKPFTFVSLP